MTMKKEEFEQLGRHFIGLWSYQAYNPSKSISLKYCVTICYKGDHYDTRGYSTQEKAMKAGVKLLKDLQPKQ